MPKKTIRLETVSRPDPNRVAILAVDRMPFFSGHENTDIQCSCCEAIFAYGCSFQSLALELKTIKVPFVLECPECGGYSQLPKAIVN